MSVVARRKGLIWLMYFAVAVFGIVMIFIGNEISQKIIGGVLLIVSAVILIQYFMIPPIAIIRDERNRLHLPKGITLDPKDIVDVSYRRASAKGVQYKWGSIVIITATAKYKCRYIADCEHVSKIITDIVYKSKSADINIFQ